MKVNVLRVNNIIKRVYKDNNQNSNIIKYEDYTINTEKRIVEKGGEEIKTTTLEFDLLVLFLKNINTCFSRENIIEQVWGSNYYGTDRVVDDLIRRIRKKLPNIKIEAVYGYGYRLS